MVAVDTHAGTISGMAKKRNEKGKGRARRKQLGYRISIECWNALDAWIKSNRPKPEITDTIELAFEEFLEKRGAWPPPAK